MDYFRALIGIVFILMLAYAGSEKRSSINWRVVLWGILIQIFFGVMVAKVGIVREAFDMIGRGFIKFFSFSQKGAQFLYGDLSQNSVGNGSVKHDLGFLFAFQALPTIIFFSSVTAGLYYLGILQKIVFCFAWIMSKTMKLSGAESLSASANVMLGQTEAPMLVRPFIEKMTRSELNCMMVGGMATIAGSVMGAYIAFLGGGNADAQARFASYLLSASIMNVPAAIVLAKMVVPETEVDKIDTKLVVSKDRLGVNLIDALARGASDGVQLSINVAGMLLAFIAIIYAFNWVLMDVVGAYMGLNDWVEASTYGAYKGFSLQYILGQIFRVVAFMAGVSWKESLYVGSLLGQKIVMNEFVAYMDLASLNNMGLLSDKAVRIATFALCGFANFSSIAIQLGGIGSMSPVRQGDIAKLGLKAMIVGSLATLLSGTMAGAIFS